MASLRLVPGSSSRWPPRETSSSGIHTFTGGALVIQDQKGRERERHAVVYGAKLKVKDGPQRRPAAACALHVNGTDCVYTAKLGDAERAIGARDPDDAELLALALALEIPVWSNDDDFKWTGVGWHTTTRLPLALYR